MKVVMRHPTREVTVDGPTTVTELLHHLDIVPESVLVIRERDLLTRSDPVRSDDTIELRPVISGGA
jgi:sulfur carrier protein ThiS